MKRFQHPVFEEARISDIVSFASDFKRRGYMFVNINATTCGDHCDVLYVFRAPQDSGASELEGRTVSVRTGEEVPSITEWFPAAFVFENEAHDLFGIDFKGISIDYEGDFYTLAVAYPMNPRAAVDAPSAEDFLKERDEFERGEVR